VTDDKLGSVTSIITVCFNDLDNLKKTITLFNSYRNISYVELIVVDGGSTDGTVEYLNNNSHLIDQWISEPDEGIGDAWNKGVRLSKGKIINFLNAGDRHLPEFLNASINTLLNKKLTITYGNTVIEVEGSISKFLNGNFSAHSIYKGFGFYHPTCFFTRDVYEQVGEFNSKISIAVDTDWLVRAKGLGVGFIKVDGINIMDGSGVSNQNRKKATLQYLAVLERNGYSRFICWVYKCRASIIDLIKSVKA